MKWFECLTRLQDFEIQIRCDGFQIKIVSQDGQILIVLADQTGGNTKQAEATQAAVDVAIREVE